MSTFRATADTGILIYKKSEGFLALRLDFLSYNNYNVSVGGGGAMRTGRPKMENAKRKTITIRLSEDLYKKIIEYATEHKLSKTDVALQSLEKFLSKEK